jgi:mRNA interferase HigB
LRTFWEVHVISRKKLREAVVRHADLVVPLDVWYRVAKKAQWKSLADVRGTFPSADAVGIYTVFNIKGNSYRLIVEINYRTGRLFVRHVLTHAQYDKGGWK